MQHQMYQQTHWLRKRLYLKFNMDTINEMTTMGTACLHHNKAGTKVSGNGATTISANGADHDESDHLRVLDSRTEKNYRIRILNGFIRGSDLGTITAPIPGGNGRLQPLAVLDPGFQHTACKESGITLM